MQGAWITAMANGTPPDGNNGSNSNGWTIADWIMFTLGIGGAAYELFIEKHPDYLKIVLVLALLRLWQTLADLLRGRS
jgi:hypothetical protein